MTRITIQFKLAPAEWHTTSRSPSPSEVSDTAELRIPSEPTVPQKRSRSQSLAVETGDEDSRQRQRAKSLSPAPKPEATAEDEVPASATLPLEPAPASDAATSSGAPPVEPTVTAVQPLPGPTSAGDHSTPAEDASSQAPVPMAGSHEPTVERQEEATLSMEVDVTEGPAIAGTAQVAPEPEQTTGPHTRPTDDSQTDAPQEPDEDHEESEIDDEEPPITLATIPQSVQEPVEEGEIETPMATAPSTAVVSSTLPLVDLNGPLAYSDLRVLECRRGSSDDELVFEFNVDQELMASLSKWAGRYKSSEWVH